MLYYRRFPTKRCFGRFSAHFIQHFRDANRFSSAIGCLIWLTWVMSSSVVAGYGHPETNTATWKFSWSKISPYQLLVQSCHTQQRIPSRHAGNLFQNQMFCNSSILDFPLFPKNIDFNSLKLLNCWEFIWACANTFIKSCWRVLPNFSNSSCTCAEITRYYFKKYPD